MSEIDNQLRPQKSKEDYSRNVKKLKVKLNKVQSEIINLQKRIQTITNTSNDKLISMKIAKFCKERRITPQMLYRFADKKNTKKISKIDFQSTLTQIGLKLTKEQFMRLEYLIDEDLSGEISYDEYNQYIDAFGIKKQFTQKDLAMREIFNKINFEEILKVTKDEDNDENNKQNRNRPKHQNMMNYEEFIKYCHKHYPQFNNKELASIFNRLQRNQLISRRDLVDFINGQAQEKRRLNEKNKKKRNQSQIKALGDQNSKSLINVIKYLINYRIKTNQNGLFHSSQFTRLESMLGTKRGQLLNLFKQIDSRRKGSFDFNELINFYIEKQTGNKDLIYTFELMGSRLRQNKQRLQEIISLYTQNQDFVSEEQLKKLFQNQFQVKNNKYEAINNLIPYQDKKISITKLLQLFKFSQARRIYVKPNIVPNRLVFRSGLQALKCCLQMQKKMNDIKMTSWNDYQFGPITGDEDGSDSIRVSLPSDNINWVRTEELGMIQFYKKQSGNLYECGAICSHDILAKSMYNLIENNESALYIDRSKINDKIKDIQEENLAPLFSGLYPLAFHPFSKYGIYVIKLFIHEKWRYIVIDDKIPCSTDKQPFFLYSKKMRYSYLSLIQKAYAKYHSNYKSVYDINDHNKYVVELSNSLAVETKLSKNMDTGIKDHIWGQMNTKKSFLQKFSKKQADKKLQKQNILYCLLKNKKDRSDNIDLSTNVPYKIAEIVEIEDNKSKNTHKSHRLAVLNAQKQFTDENSWNPSWNRTQNTNKFGANSTTLSNKLKEPTILKNKKNILINYKLLRANFNLFKYYPIEYNQMIILRKELEFEEHIKCRYELSSKYDLQFVIVLNPITNNLGDNKIILDFKNEKDQLINHIIYKDFIIHQVYLMKDVPLNIEIELDNIQKDASRKYNLSFYMFHPRYELKQRDRHMLFRFVSPYEQEPRMDFGEFQSQQRQFIYKQFYRAAQRRGCFGCC